MELKLIGNKNQTDKISVSDVLFNRDYNEAENFLNLLLIQRK